jgi:hypothetical protein
MIKNIKAVEKQFNLLTAILMKNRILTNDKFESTKTRPNRLSAASY